MLTVNHITSLISINWITGSKLYYLNWFFQRNLTVKCQCLNISSCIIKTRLASNKRGGGRQPLAELILARGRLAQVSVLHKNLYRILKQHPFCETVTIKSWHPPMLLCVCHCRLPTNASQPCDSLQSMWRLHNRPQLLCSLANRVPASSAATAKDFLPNWAHLINSCHS